MAAHEYYEPLRAVPPITETDRRFAYALWFREQAARAYDAVVSAPRKAATYAARLAEKLHLTGPLAWLRQRASALLRPIAGLPGRFGPSGTAAAITTILTSPRGQAVLGKAASVIARAASWVGHTTYGLVDRGLRLFGETGARAADALSDVLVAGGGRVAVLMAPVVYRVARLTDPETPWVRLIAGISRSYLLHRALKLLIANPFARLVVEGLVSLAALDTRVSGWARSLTRQLRVRYVSLREQAAATYTRGRTEKAKPAGQPSPASPLDMPTWVPEAGVPDEELLRPSNRAERRLHEKQQARKKNRPGNQ